MRTLIQRPAMLFYILTGILFMISGACTSANHVNIPGAWQTEEYIHLLEGKRVAFAGNHTATIGHTHLVDSLLAKGIQVVKVFSPEHGFRGQAAAGELVESSVDEETGIPIISLYGASRRPTPEQLQDVDIILFDIQDVGARFYTYISGMTYIMEEAAKENVPMLILDRPNPIRHYIDGPVLERQHRSFVGLHPVPVVHGMTVGEFALMINGEGWLENGLICDVRVIPVKNHDQRIPYNIPLPPSPNLPNMHSIYLYPSLCFFEGTVISLGRGTNKPFQVYGHPKLPKSHFPFTFTPVSVQAAPNPPQMGQVCNGIDLSSKSLDQLFSSGELNLDYLIHAYRHFPDQDKFFNNFFERLAGTDKLRRQIIDGLTPEEIRVTWQSGLEAYKETRAKYLLYPDH